LWGILPRAAEYLFGELADKAEDGLLTYHVKASFLQLYNEHIFDLLQSGGPKIDSTDYNNNGSSYMKQLNSLKIREIPKPTNRQSFGGVGSGPASQASEVYVAGLSEFWVQTASDVMKILAAGTYNRATRCTDFNATSSRSHAVLTLTFDIESYGEGELVTLRFY
jgi:centromeric protein E